MWNCHSVFRGLGEGSLWACGAAALWRRCHRRLPALTSAKNECDVTSLLMHTSCLMLRADRSKATLLTNGLLCSWECKKLFQVSGYAAGCFLSPTPWGQRLIGLAQFQVAHYVARLPPIRCTKRLFVFFEGMIVLFYRGANECLGLGDSITRKSQKTVPPVLIELASRHKYSESVWHFCFTWLETDQKHYEARQTAFLKSKWFFPSVRYVVKERNY